MYAILDKITTGRNWIIMHKWLVSIFLIGICFFTLVAPTQAQGKVMWDGAEIVKDQSGKIAFTKDIKVYKEVSLGKFVSMVVKKGNYLRVYDIEKYNGKVYYWMSSGYRVQATNLVRFKEVPMNLRVSFFDDYTWIVSSKEGIEKLSRPYGRLLQDYGDQERYFIVNGKLQEEYPYSPGKFSKEFISGTDVKVIERQSIPLGYYVTTRDTTAYEYPIPNAKFQYSFAVEKNTLVSVRKSWERDSGIAFNGFVKNTSVYNLDNGEDDTYKNSLSGYVNIKDLKPLEDFKPIGTYYTTKDFKGDRYFEPSIPANEAVTLYVTQDDYGIISYKDRKTVVKLAYLSKTPLNK